MLLRKDLYWNSLEEQTAICKYSNCFSVLYWEIIYHIVVKYWEGKYQLQKKLPTLHCVNKVAYFCYVMIISSRVSKMCP